MSNAERAAIIDRLRPKILAFNLPIEDVKEVLTRLALTDIDVLRDIERDGFDLIAKRLKERKEAESKLCPTCHGNGTVKIPGGVSVCPTCNGRCWR